MSNSRNLADLLDSNGDVKSGALDNVPPADVVNDTTPQLGGDLAANGNDITFGDNDKAIFGAGSDLQIYHDATSGNSFIEDAGTGNLYLKSDGSGVVVNDGTNTIARFLNTNSMAELWYSGGKKLATTSTGIDVTGTVTADGLTVQANYAEFLAADGNRNIRIAPAVAGVDHRIYSSLSSAGYWFENNTRKLIHIAGTGDISFYEDTGTTPKFFWDASAESLGIVTSTPSEELHIYKNTTDSVDLKIENSEGSATLKANNDSFYIDADNHVFRSEASSERMRIDSSGNLLVGKTTTSTADQGIQVNPTGRIDSTSNSAEALRLNRKTSDGAIAQFRKDNSVVGSISVTGSGTTYNTTSDRRLKDNIETITDGTDKLMAMNPVTHTWIADPEAPAVHGFIAQEMQDVIPEAVSGEDGGDEMMSMDYGRITPVIVAALQDAHRKIQELESRLAAVEK
jgi:hypothetical protein